MAQDFTHRINSQVEYRSPEEMKKYHQGLIYEALKKVQIKKRIVSNPHEIPYALDLNPAIPQIELLNQFLVNTAGLQFAMGFLEVLEEYYAAYYDKESISAVEIFQKMAKKIEEYKFMLATLSENCAILQQQLKM